MKRHPNIRISKRGKSGRTVTRIIVAKQDFEGYPVIEILSGYSERKSAAETSELQVHVKFLDKDAIHKIWDIYARCVRLENGETTSPPEPFFRENWHVEHFG